jgi:hypothetical protein
LDPLPHPPIGPRGGGFAEVLSLVADLPFFNPFKPSKPMAERRCHGNGLTAWLTEWSRARRLPLLFVGHLVAIQGNIVRTYCESPTYQEWWEAQFSKAL